MIQIDYSRDSLFDENGLLRLRESYMTPEEKSPQDRFKFVSEVFSSNPEHAQRLYDYSSKHWLSYSTPILSFGKSKRGLPISCYLNYIEDTAEGLVNNESETNWLSMLGGGVGIGFGIRAAGDKSTGVLPHLKIYDASSLAYKQGKTRRGSYAAYLDISHPDIVMFIEMRKPTGDPNLRCPNLHHGVNVTDDFMQIIERCMIDPTASDDWNLIDPHTGEIRRVVSAKDLWQRLLETRTQTGEPYLHFIDTSNRYLPTHLKDLSLRIQQSNLCLSEDTLIATSTGPVAIKKLFNQQTIIFDSKTWISNDQFRLINSEATLYRVYLSDGSTVDCTAEHRWFTKPKHLRESEAKEYKETQTKNLTVGMKLQYHLEEFHGKEQIKSAYAKGFLIAEGTRMPISAKNSNSYKAKLNIYGEKIKCISRLKTSIQETEPTKGLRSDCIINVNFIKDGQQNRLNTQGLGVRKDLVSWTNEYKNGIGSIWFSWNKNSKLEFLAGLFDGDGTTVQGRSYQLTSISRVLLTDIQLMLKSLGIRSHLSQSAKAGMVDFHDGYGEYPTKDSWRITISSYWAWEFSKIIKFERLPQFQGKKPNRYCCDFNRIIQIEQLPGLYPVYCTTVNSTGKFALANGLITGNCSEVFLPTDKNRTAVCCLSSLNLELFDEWKNDPTFISDIAEMLDNVLQYFIDNAPKTISRAIYSATRERSIGVGALGFHAYLQSRNIPFESVIAKSLNIKIFKHIKAQLDIANLELGKLRGEAPDATGTGKRFSHLMAIAPNASSSIIVGNTSPSIEPFKANAYRQDTLSGSYLHKNKYLDRIIQKHCKENKTFDYQDIWSSIISTEGSVQHLEFLDQNTRDVFKTAIEIDQRWIIEHAADRQVFIDQGQSLNIFVRPDVNIKYLHALHFLAWKREIKSLYYCRSEKKGKADSISQKVERKVIEEIDFQQLIEGNSCLACEG